MRSEFRISRDWAFLLAYLIVIFAVLPFSGHIVGKIIEISPFFSLLISFSVYAAVWIIGIALAIYVINADKSFKIPRLVALAIILYIALDGLGKIGDPRDRLHLIEYSI